MYGISIEFSFEIINMFNSWQEFCAVKWQRLGNKCNATVNITQFKSKANFNNHNEMRFTFTENEHNQMFIIAHIKVLETLNS